MERLFNRVKKTLIGSKSSFKKDQGDEETYGYLSSARVLAGSSPFFSVKSPPMTGM